MDSKILARTTHIVPAPEGDLEHVSSIVRRSTRHLVVDVRFAEILVEDFPALSVLTIGDALTGYPQKAAIEICAWAARCDDPRRALRNWAKKHRPDRPRVRECDGCRGAFEERDLVEVTEENSAFTLSVFVGEGLCRDCASNAGIL